jgi:hypothetical protein
MSMLFAVRGRGLANLIRGLTEGDPVAWGIVGVVGLFTVGSIIVKSRKG